MTIGQYNEHGSDGIPAAISARVPQCYFGGSSPIVCPPGLREFFHAQAGRKTRLLARNHLSVLQEQAAAFRFLGGRQLCPACARPGPPAAAEARRRSRIPAEASWPHLRELR